VGVKDVIEGVVEETKVSLLQRIVNYIIKGIY